jgi:hypothetical protein
MRKAIIAMAAAGMLVLAGAGMTRAAELGFGNVNFHGVYPFALHGTTMDTPDVPMAGGGILRPDGKGNFSGSLNVNVGGNVCSSDIAGTYSIAANGTGTLSIASTSNTCTGVPADYDLVMFNGRHVDLFSTDSGSVVSVNATRRRADLR